MNCRLIIVDGIMGSGKSQTTKWLAATLQQNNSRVRPVEEPFWPHPTRVITDLSRPLAPWLELTAADMARRSLNKWHEFVTDLADSDELVVLDGQLFHGDMTSLMMMEMPPSEIEEYVGMIYEEIAVLKPFLIYFYQDDPGAALKQISIRRKPLWLRQQLAWKLASPFARRRKLSDLDGLIDFYKEYRNLTDILYNGFNSGKCRIDNQKQNWNSYYQIICAELKSQAGLQLNLNGGGAS